MLTCRNSAEGDGMKQIKKPAKIKHVNFYSSNIRTLLVMCFSDTVTTIHAGVLKCD